MIRVRELEMAVSIHCCLLPRSPTINFGTNNDSGTRKTN